MPSQSPPAAANKDFGHTDPGDIILLLSTAEPCVNNGRKITYCLEVAFTVVTEKYLM